MKDRCAQGKLMTGLQRGEKWKEEARGRRKYSK